MKKLLVVVLGLGVVGVLLSPAFGSGAGDGRKVLDAKVLAPVSEPFTGSARSPQSGASPALRSRSPGSSAGPA